MNASRLSVGIVGGSLAGLFTAALLQNYGIAVTVLERSPTGLAHRGAGLVGQRELFDILERLGLTSVLHSGVEARERIVLDRHGAVVHRDPTPQTQFSWDVLWEGLRSLIPDDRYVLDSPAALVVSGTQPEVVLETGHALGFDVVIGADGLGSVTRRAVVPHHSDNSYVGYVTWRGLVPESVLPAASARALLERFAFYTAPGEHVLGYLVPGANGETARGHRRYNWVWYRRMSLADLEALMRHSGRSLRSTSLAPGDLSPDARQGLWSDAEAKLPGVFAEAVLSEHAPFLQAIVDFVPPHLTAGGVALVGDAAVVVRPHTAMGAAKAAGDAMTLADHLASATNSADALARYGRDRLPVGRSIALYGQRLGASLPL